MKNEMQGNCIWLGCKKEVLEEGYKFCGEHERKYKEIRDNTVKGFFGLVFTGIFITVKSVYKPSRKR